MSRVHAAPAVCGLVLMVRGHRHVFLRTQAAKERLRPALPPGSSGR